MIVDSLYSTLPPVWMVLMKMFSLRPSSLIINSNDDDDDHQLLIIQNFKLSYGQQQQQCYKKKILEFQNIDEHTHTHTDTRAHIYTDNGFQFNNTTSILYNHITNRSTYMQTEINKNHPTKKKYSNIQKIKDPICDNDDNKKRVFECNKIDNPNKKKTIHLYLHIRTQIQLYQFIMVIVLVVVV